MFKTLRISFSLKNTYRVNSILYSIKQLPILKKILPAGIYQVRFFKIFANILSVIWEVISAFLGKLIYFLIMLLVPIGYLSADDPVSRAGIFLHIFIPLTVIGSFINTYMFDPTRDKYYAIILLGMDARRYTLVNYFYAILKIIAAFALFGVIFGLMVGLPLYQCLLLPFAAAGLKLAVAAKELRTYEKKGTVSNENKMKGVFGLIIIIIGLALAYALPFFDIVIPRNIGVIVLGLFILLGLVSLPKILRFKSYRPMYKLLLREDIMFNAEETALNVQKEATKKNISTDTDIKSSKKGFEYLNELFIKRHKKILWKSSVTISFIALALLVGSVVLFYINPDLGSDINKLMMTILPYFVFVMYIINRGTTFTQALFINCDNSLLTYSFFKKPKYILRLFRIRLRELIKINLLPATVIGGGLALLLFISGGTDNPINYVILFVSIVCLSIFFSVHYLTLYYLLQPYNAGTEIKSAAYQFCMSATYIVCYFFLQLQLPTFIFGLLTIIFCILYCIIACILVYFLAPKTFRIRS